MRLLQWFLSFVRIKSTIPCAIKECKSTARYAAHVVYMETTMGSFSESSGSFRPICGSPACLARMIEIEGTDRITLFPIEESFFSIVHV